MVGPSQAKLPIILETTSPIKPLDMLELHAQEEMLPQGPSTNATKEDDLVMCQALASLEEKKPKRKTLIEGR